MHAYLDIFQHRHGVEQTDVLKGTRNAEADDAAASQVIQLLAVEGDHACAWRIDTGDHVKDGGFTGAVGTDQAENFAFGHIEVEIVDGDESAEASGYLL